jgi:Uma2 family endonuclease
MTSCSQAPTGYSVENYFRLVTTGELAPNDRVELLEGVIVAEPPQEPRHASAITRLDALRKAIADRAVVRVQLPFLAGPFSAPEPDIAVVPGRAADYDLRHPTAALLIIEVADASLPQDRLSKQRIYAAAGCLEYWIVNLRDDCVEVYRAPDKAAGRYTQQRIARAGEHVDLVAFTDVRIAVDDIVPRRSVV